MMNPILLRLMVEDRTRELRGVTDSSRRRSGAPAANRRRAAATLRLLRASSRRN
jgi:hypothetical protein